MQQITQQILPAGLPATTVWGYGGRGGAEQPRAADPQRPVADDRGAVEPAGPGQVDQRAQGRQRQLPAAPAAGRPDAALGEPARRHRRSRHATDVHRDARPLHRPGSDRHPRARRRRRGDESDGYAEAWYLPAANNIPDGYATEGTWYDFFAGKAAAGLRRRRGVPASPTFQYPNREPGVDDLVPRPRARHDAPERLRGPGRLLPDPRRPGRRRARLAHRTGGEPARARRRARTTSSRPTSPTGRSRSRSRTASFNEDGSLFYPDSRAFFDGIVRALHPGRASSRRSGIPSSSGT